MYSSLDKGDIIVGLKDGRTIVVQTDHRDTSEIEAERDLSTVFAIVRVLVAAKYRTPEMKRFEVHYAIHEKPPEFLHQAIASAGGILLIDEKEVAYPGRPPDMLQLLNSSFSNLGRSVAQRHKRPVTLEGLKDVEGIYLGLASDYESAGTEYWTSVVELSAYSGEVMRSLRGGGWNAINMDVMELPVVYECGPVMSNFLGKTMRFFHNGMEDSLAYLIISACNQMDQMGLTGHLPPPQRPMVLTPEKKKKGLLGRMFSKGS